MHVYTLLLHPSVTVRVASDEPFAPAVRAQEALVAHLRALKLDDLVVTAASCDRVWPHGRDDGPLVPDGLQLPHELYTAEQMQEVFEAGKVAERNRCRYPDCLDNEDGTCSRWLTGECGGPLVPDEEARPSANGSPAASGV